MSPAKASTDKVTSALLEALGSSLDLRVVLERTYPLLLQLIPADYGALGISTSGRAEDYEWIVAEQRWRASRGDLRGIRLPRTLSLFARAMGARYVGAPAYDPYFGVYALPLIAALTDVCAARLRRAKPAPAEGPEHPGAD